MWDDGAVKDFTFDFDVVSPDTAHSSLYKRKVDRLCTCTLTTSSHGEETLKIPRACKNDIELKLSKPGFSPQSRAEILFEIVQVQKNSALSYALNLLNARDYTTHDLKHKLHDAGFWKEPIDQTLAFVIEKHYVDDARYAESYIKAKQRQGWGQKKISAGLYKRGIDTHVLDGWPDSHVSFDDETSRALLALQKKYRSYDASRESMVRFLAQRGFRQNVCYDAVNTFEHERLENE